MEKILLNLTSIYIQNWLANTAKYSGLAILLTLLFASCEEIVEKPASKLIPGENNTTLKFIEIPLDVEQAAFNLQVVEANLGSGSAVNQFDSVFIRSSNNIINGINDQNASRGIIYFGSQDASQVGSVKASAYGGLTLETGFIRDSISSTSELVDVSLVMRFTNLYGTDFGMNEEFIVSRLAVDSLTNNRSTKYTVNDALPVAEKISKDSSLRVNPEILLEPDTTDNDSIVVYLSEAFGEDLIRLIANEGLSSSELSSAIRGIKIETEGNLNNLYGLSIAPTRSYISLNYTKENAPNENVKLNFITTSFTQTDFMPGALVPANYSGDKSFSLTDPNKVYLNDFLGIQPKLDLTNYLSFIDSLEFMLIDRADLVIEADLDDVLNPTTCIAYPRQLLPYIMEDGLIAKVAENFRGIQTNFASNGGLSNQSGTASLNRLFYDEVENRYRADITFFLQQIFDDADFWSNEQSVLLTSQFLNTNEVAFTPSAPFLIDDYENFLIDTDNIKLRIYYTTFED